jgi:hypothetical protein
MSELQFTESGNSPPSASDYILSLFCPDDLIAIMTLCRGEQPKHIFAKASEVATDKFMTSLREQNEAGADIYVCMNPLTAKRRVKENVSAIRTLYLDIDNNGAAALDKIAQSALVPPPHFTLQSSPNKFQVIWSVTGIEPAEQERLLDALIQEFGGDPAASDCTRVLRLPNFINHKYDTKPVVEIIKTTFDGDDYAATDFKVTVAPVRLAEKTPRVIEAGERNDRLASLAGKLRREGFEQEEILATLQTANRRCSVPLSDVEVATIAKSISKYPPARVEPNDCGANDAEPNPEVPPVIELVRPTLSETAYYGLAGAITKKLEPCTESHPAGLLLELMISFGNLIGRCAYIQVEDTKHFTNEFMVKVGESSRSRKGTGKNRIRAIMEQVDPEWLQHRNVSGIGSGEVIIHLIRDAHSEYFFDKKKGTGSRVVTDAGIDDKRLCVNLGEFQGILSVCHRPDNLLSVVMRDGWDGLPLHNLVKTNPASCAEGLLSLLADVTRADLSVSLNQADRANGFANRFLWAYVYRTKLLPEGGGDMDWSAEVPLLREAIEFSKRVGRVYMDKAARDRWCRTVYPKLEREISGLVGALTARGSAHTMRLALLYALLDKSDHIRLEHLEAAEALWQYCEDSVQAIFGDLLSPEQSQILEFLTHVDYATKTQLIRDCFKGHRSADLIESDLRLLQNRKRIVAKSVDKVNQYRFAKSARFRE